jgi:hypothetical protein
MGTLKKPSPSQGAADDDRSEVRELHLAYNAVDLGISVDTMVSPMTMSTDYTDSLAYLKP